MGSEGIGSKGPDRSAFTDGYDEDRDEQGVPRPGYAQLFDALSGVDLAALTAAVTRQLDREGVNFGGDPFVVDPVPRLILAAAWDELARGLAQRGRALNHFLLDAYREQRVVEAGIVAAETIREAEGFEADLMGRLPTHEAPAAVIGFDVVRAPSGEFLVLEDNVRTPSGIAYALAARAAVAETLPATSLRPRPIDPVIYEMLGRCLRAAAPPGTAAPSVVLLTDGPQNVAYFEHAQAAERLGVPLVTPDALIADGSELRVELAGGATAAVDVVYRRTDEDRVRDERGEMTDVARLLLPSWLSGNLGLVNGFGNGIADDKLVHSHVEDFIRFYLDEEPLVRSVPTQALNTAADAREAIGRLRELVIKPRHGHGGKGVVIGAHADEADLHQLAAELEENPERYIRQPTVALSRHPTVIGGELSPRHVDLRVFAFCGDAVELAPGGLSRVAMQADALVVNSSQQGGGKDTWVIDG
jgi:uncharacterized circularly permuted ATP-grasp superfamily protein